MMSPSVKSETFQPSHRKKAAETIAALDLPRRHGDVRLDVTIPRRMGSPVSLSIADG